MKNKNAQINAARIAKINHSVTLNSTLSPYMLFPVRLETHFREVPVSTRPPHEAEVEQVFRGFNEIIHRLHLTFLAEDKEAVVFPDTLPEAFHDLKVKIEELDLLSSEDKTAIVSIASMLQKTLYDITLLPEEKYLNKYVDDLLVTAKNIEVSTAIKENTATVFLKELRATFKSLKTLAEYTHTPYRSKTYYKQRDKQKEENERLYRYVTGRVIRIAGFFKTADARLKEIPCLDNRQRKVAVRNLYANNFSEWNNLFSVVSQNMQSIYRGLSYQNQKLLEKYNGDWKSILKDAQLKCKNFTAKFDNNIKDKPRTMFNYSRLIQSALQFDVELLGASASRNFISYNQLEKKIFAINRLAEKTILKYNSEKDFLRGLLQQVVKNIEVYATLIKNENYTDYQNPDKNKNLCALVNLRSIESISLSVGNEVFANQKQLCVRIFPDDIFIHQHDKLLTEEEMLDGKRFWIRWFIASANRIYEKEAWNVLCRKHTVMRASWIVRMLFPLNRHLHEDRRPYKNNKEMEEVLSDLVKSSNEYDLSESKSKVVNEKNMHNCVVAMLPKFYEVRRIVMQYDKIVDYLFQRLNNDLGYVKRRLESFIMFYDQHPEYKVRDDMAYVDIDYQSLIAFYSELKDLILHIQNREVSLEEMVNEYLERLDKKDVFFPKIDKLRNADIYSPPVSAIMPDRFLFFGDTKLKVNGKERKKRIVYAGRKVKKNLKLGFDLTEDDNVNPYKLNLETGEMEARGGIRWMTDYETAVKSGMAISVPLPHTDEQFAKARFTSIYVLGVKDQPEDIILEEFFNGHIYGQSGLDFLKIGTPTNSFDDIVSGYNSDESLLEERRFEIEIEEKFKTDNHLFNSLKRVIGVDRKTYENSIGRTNSFDNAEIAKAAKANSVMCNAFKDSFTVGKDGTVLRCKTKLFLDQIPKFVTSHCFARGIFPPLRIGNQPYGLLPTTAFSRFQFEGASEKAINDKDRKFLQFARELHQLLKRITDIWSSIRKKHVICSENLGNGDPQKRYLEMMGLTPTSVAFFERNLIEALPLLHPAINYMPIENTNRSIAKILKDVLDIPLLGEKRNVAILDQLDLFKAHPVAGMVKELKDEVSGIPELKPFIDRVLSPENKQELKELIPENEIPLLITEFMDLFTYRLDAWWLGLVNYQLQRIRNGVFGKASKANSIGAFGWLFNLERGEKGIKKSLSEQKTICEEMKLSDKTTPIYEDSKHNEFILAPSINHAITAAILRSSYNNSKKSGDDSRLNINLSSLRVRQALRVIDGVRNGLSIGAVLGADLERSMHEAYKSNERSELDRYIYPLRQLFPLKMDLESEQKGPEANSYIMTVINGELLLNSTLKEYEKSRQKPIADYLMESNDTTIQWFHDLFQERDQNHKKTMALLIEQIADTFDALGDLILSEGVYQLVQGNRVAFAALMQNLENGNVIANPQVTEIPMHSAVVRHKTAIAMNCTTETEVSGWNSAISSETGNETIIENAEWVMAKTEPALNHWIGSLLSDAHDISFVVTRTETVENEEVKTDIPCSLADLGISPLEYFYLSTNMTIFTRFLELGFRKKYNLFSEKLSIDYKKTGEQPEGNKRSLFENEWMMNSLRNVIANSRVLTAEDFSTTIGQTDEINLKGIDTGELGNRYNSLLLYCENLNKRFSQFVVNYSDPVKAQSGGIISFENEYFEVTDLLIQGASLGISESLTSLSPELFAPKTSDEELLKMQNNLLVTLVLLNKNLGGRIEKAKALAKKFESDDEDSIVSAYTQAIQALLSTDFKVIPRFCLNPLSDVDLNAQSTQLNKLFSYSNASPMQIEAWTGEVSKVREPIGQLQQVRVFSDFLGVDHGETAVLQFPFHPEKDKEWLGREVSSEDIVEDKDSLVLFDRKNFSSDKTKSNAGLIIDQWMELIPYEHQRGGVVFNFDQPNAEAPQVILLAVPSKINMRERKDGKYEAKNWTLSELITTLNDTRVMAENRAVEPDHLYAETELAKIIPLLKYGKESVPKK